MPWVLLACTCVSVCCPEVGGVCEAKVLEPCSPKLETDVSDARLLEVRSAIWTVSPGFCCVCDVAALEGNTLVSGCPVEPGWDEVRPFSGSPAVDDWVVCGTTPFASDWSVGLALDDGRD